MENQTTNVSEMVKDLQDNITALKHGDKKTSSKFRACLFTTVH